MALFENNNGTPVLIAGRGNITDKADKVSNATNGDLASLDANGNLVDSGVSKDIIPSDASASNKLLTAFSNVTYWSASDTTSNTLANQPTNSRYEFGWGALKLCSDVPTEIASDDYEAIVDCMGSLGTAVRCQVLYTRGTSLISSKSYFRFYNTNGQAWETWKKLLNSTDLTASVTSDSTAPVTSGGVYNVTAISEVSSNDWITLESGYSLPDFTVWKQNNRVWGYGVISTTGAFNHSQGKIGTIKTGYKPKNAAINSVCFISNNRYGGGTFDAGYFWIDSGQVLIGNPSGDDTKNFAKFSFDYCFE